jgi:hypothetical protein
MPPFWITWPLRKAALVPVVAIGAAALGAAVGAFDLTRRAVSVVLPVRKRRPGTSAVAWSAAAVSGGGVLVLRELFFAPNVIPPPALPVDASVPLPARLRNAGIVAAHTVLHYPYAFRFTGAFAAGAAAAAALVVAEKVFNAGAGNGGADPAPLTAGSRGHPSAPTVADDHFGNPTAAVLGPSEAAAGLQPDDAALAEDLAELDGKGTVVKYSDDPYER